MFLIFFYIDVSLKLATLHQTKINIEDWKYMLNISRLATNYGTLDAYYLHMDKSILALTTQ